MNVQFAMAQTGKRPVENGYSPFFYIETDELRFMLHPNLLIFVEMTLTEPFAKCLHETMTAEVFLRDKLPFMQGAAARAKREIDDVQLHRFLSYVRQGEAVPAPRPRERTRLAPDQGVSRVRERVLASTGVALPPLQEPAAPRIRERTRVAGGYQAPAGATPPPTPPSGGSSGQPPRVRTRTRG